jgi:hypothetical protein
MDRIFLAIIATSIVALVLALAIAPAAPARLHATHLLQAVQTPRG